MHAPAEPTRDRLRDPEGHQRGGEILDCEIELHGLQPLATQPPARADVSARHAQRKSFETQRQRLTALHVQRRDALARDGCPLRVEREAFDAEPMITRSARLEPQLGGSELRMLQRVACERHLPGRIRPLTRCARAELQASRDSRGSPRCRQTFEYDLGCEIRRIEARSIARCAERDLARCTSRDRLFQVESAGARVCLSTQAERLDSGRTELR